MDEEWLFCDYMEVSLVTTQDSNRACTLSVWLVEIQETVIATNQHGMPCQLRFGLFGGTARGVAAAEHGIQGDPRRQQAAKIQLSLPHPDRLLSRFRVGVTQDDRDARKVESRWCFLNS